MSLHAMQPDDLTITPAAKATAARRNTTNFLLHLRPKYYPSPAVYVQTTWLLGFFSVFCLALEVITGILLMVYYVPTPGGAYNSIGRLTAEIPFGMLFRDLHRLGGEVMIVVVTLHLLRVYIGGAYRQQRRGTWVTGIGLWLLTLLLAFSGYLLPWDQLAYWAVTIGTSIADTIPVIGREITTILRGGPSFGAEGLLRFYLLHIIALPALFLLLLGIHYYRVVRLHGVLVVDDTTSTDHARCHNQKSSKVRFLPEIPLTELLLSLVGLTILTVAAAWCYDAPLQHHADPLLTPAAVRAPWFFLWLQGALKLGDSFVMGICVPLAALLLLTFFPYFPALTANMSNPWHRKIILVMGGATLLGLTFLGLPRYGSNLSPAAVILNGFIPEESSSRFHHIGFAYLPQGIYSTKQPSADLPGPLQLLLKDLAIAVRGVPGVTSVDKTQGIIMIEDWQANLKRITLRIHRQDDPGSSTPTSIEKQLYLHRRQDIEP